MSLPHHAFPESLTDHGSNGATRPIVLTAEVDEDTRALLRRQLERAGFEVVEVLNSETIVELTEQAKPDVVLLDTDMPTENGYEILERLKANEATRNIPVVLLTAEDSIDNVVTGLNLGAHDHLRKPFVANELVARTSAALRVKRLQDELYRRNADLSRKAATDSLTGLANRRSGEERLAALGASARRHRFPLSAVLVDVDHFKNINDTYGHTAGDRVLIEVAQRLLSALRIDDVAVRWGGEEFLLLLPMTDFTGAHQLAERARVALGDVPIEVGSGPAITVTASFGIGQGSDTSQLLAGADRALYEAKASGRNCIRP